MFWNPLETLHLITSETVAPFLSILSCTCSSDCGDTRILLLLSGDMIGSLLEVLIGYYSRYGVNQVSLRSILFGSLLCEIFCARYFQFGGILPSLMNGTVENSSSNATRNWGETWPVAGFITRGTDHLCNGEWPIYLPAREQGSHLCIPDMLHCNISSKT